MIGQEVPTWTNHTLERVGPGKDRAIARATGRALNDVLTSGTWDVVHYAGHAAFDRQQPELSGLLLADDEVFFAEKIQRLLEGRPLVFLNATEARWAASVRCGRSTTSRRPQLAIEF